jgi:hypothetical protein
MTLMPKPRPCDVSLRRTGTLLPSNFNDRFRAARPRSSMSAGGRLRTVC